MAVVFGPTVSFAIDERRKIDQIAQDIVNDVMDRFDSDIQEFALTSAGAESFEALDEDKKLEDCFVAVRSALFSEIFKSAARQAQASEEAD